MYSVGTKKIINTNLYLSVLENNIRPLIFVPILCSDMTMYYLTFVFCVPKIITRESVISLGTYIVQHYSYYKYMTHDLYHESKPRACCHLMPLDI